MGPRAGLGERREEKSHRLQLTTADPACSIVIAVCVYCAVRVGSLIAR